MSEFELASLDYRTATLAARHMANWIAATGIFVSVLQTGIVAWGIREMIRANRERGQRADAQARTDERRLDERRRADEQRHEEQLQADERRYEERLRADEQRHVENMRRLDTLIEGQAEQRRGSVENTRRLDALLEEMAAQRRASDAQTRALLESLERVSPKPPTSS